MPKHMHRQLHHERSPAASRYLAFMKISILSGLSLAFAMSANAQKSVPITSEPHHHLVFSGDQLKVYRVEVPKGASTLLHEHAVDYFWIGIGAAEFANDVPGKPEAKVTSVDGGVHFTKGNFSHIARIDGPGTFRNVTLELPRTQTNPHNLCAVVLADQPANCTAAAKRASTEYAGVTSVAEFETDQTRVTLLTIAPDATMNFSKVDRAPIFVAVDDADAAVHTTCMDASGAKTNELKPKSGEAFAAKAAKCVIHNATAKPLRFLAVEIAP